MLTTATFTPREVAELSGAPRHVIEKAIEDHILRVCSQTPGGGPQGPRMLPLHAVAYAAVVGKLDLRLSVEHKKRLADGLALLSAANIDLVRMELTPGVELNIGRLAGDVTNRAARYRAARDRAIVTDEAIKGGTPVIRGTRMTVYSVLGQVEHGDTIDDILADNPDLDRDAIEAAIIYARTHPMMGRPSGRPWAHAA